MNTIINNKRNSIFLLTSFLIMLLTGVSSCNDDYDDHYSFDGSKRSELNLLDYMKSRSDLNKFVQLLEFTGYSDTLTLSRTFTVFALTNDVLKDLVLDESNKENLKLFTANHLTSDAQTFPRTIKAFNGKYIVLSRWGDVYTYGGVTVTEPNLLAKNGIIHIMESPVFYTRNIWEFIQQQESLDSLRNYINSLTERVFDSKKSFDEDGVFIDSVFTESNLFLDNLGPVYSELFYSSAILPTNAAWRETYDKISPFYQSLDIKEDGEIVATGAELQEAQTKLSIVKDCIFRNLLSNPVENDSIISTGGTVFKTPGYLFENSTRYALSNGYAYVTDQMKNKLEDSWLKVLTTEAENNTNSLRTEQNCELIPYRTSGSEFKASNNYYVRFEKLPTTDYSAVSAKFPIANTLANVKYNIYCVFVPTNARDLQVTKPYKLKFYLSYIDADGNQKKDVALPVGNPITEPDKITKMLVAENYQFSYCDLTASEINVFLKVENAATVREERNDIYSRNVCIDCIILEPVIE